MGKFRVGTDLVGGEFGAREGGRGGAEGCQGGCGTVGNFFHTSYVVGRQWSTSVGQLMMSATPHSAESVDVVGSVPQHEPGDTEKVSSRLRARQDLFPMEFNTIGVSDGMSMGTKGMRYSLPSRDLIADSLETICQAQVGCPSVRRHEYGDEGQSE